jgi:DNA primase
MAGKIPQEFIDDLLYKTDLVELIGRHVTLKKSGSNYTGCCPFHDEKTPSFSVSPNKQFYYCFGCRANGNALGFLMDYKKLSFNEAIEQLAQQNGVNIPNSSIPNQPQYSHLLDVLQTANQYYNQQLTSPIGQKARHYLHQRGVNSQTQTLFDLGYAPSQWDALTQLFRRSNQLDQAEKAGLCIAKPERHYDRFRDRLMFPIKNPRGQVVGFGGRIFDDGQPKYLNSPETPLFHKQRLLYGLHEAQQSKIKRQHLIITEGYMDVIALSQLGFPHCVATLGTSTSEHHIELLFKQVDKLIFCFDGDKAGRSAAHRALDSCLGFLQEGREVSFLFLPETDDPDSLIRRDGSQAFEQRLQQALPISEMIQRTLGDDLNLMQVDGRAHFATRCRTLLSKIPNNLYRQLLLQALADFAQLSPDMLISAPPVQTPQTTLSTQTPAAPSTRTFSSTKTTSTSLTGNKRPKTPWKPNNKTTGTAVASNSPPQPRALSLTDQMMLMMLQHPALAKDLTLEDDVSEFSSVKLLKQLQTTLLNTPEANCAYLLGRWHGTTMGDHLAQLLSRETLLIESDPDAWPDALAQLQHQLLEQQLEHEMRKSHPDHQRLRTLLARKAQLFAPTT